MYQTPRTHRIFTKESTMSDIGKENLVTDEDSHFVFVRPKAIVGSSGSTSWTSETVRLRQRNLDLFEGQGNNQKYSAIFRQVCAVIHDSFFLYQDMTKEEDLLNATGLNQCMYTGYENERLRNLKRELESALSISDT